MEFRILGPVEIRAGEQTLDIGHARQRAVLAVLLLDLGRAVSAERLIDRVWGDTPPASVRNVLYGYVARIRVALSGAKDDSVTLRRGQGGYLLEADPQLVDVHRFRDLVGQANAPDAGTGELLGKALSCWHGSALAGLDSPWLNAMRHTLELERHAAQLDLNDVRLRLGQHATLVSDLTVQAAASPADERLIGQLMLALYRSGRQAEALRWFEQTRRHLADDLGTDPAPELRELHQQILAADRSLRLAATATSGPTAPLPRELPPDVAAFTGRAAELAALDDLLLGAQKTTAAVISAVSGTAGVGKTALAVHWAHHAAYHFPDGQLYVNLRGYDPDRPMTATDALAGFLRSLGVPGQDIPPEESDRITRYRSLLAGKQMLIVLDNAATIEQVRPLLPGHPGCRVLVTSRDSLAGLVARDGAKRIDLDLLPLDDAVALLRELIGDRADAEPAAVITLAGQCARLPLALRIAAELAVARPTEPLTNLVDELADEKRRLDLLRADGDQRTAVRAVFSWSCDHLDAEAVRTFQLAGLHPGIDFDAYAVAALAGNGLGQARRLLDTLARAHLVQPTVPGRYGMHDLLRAYARDLAAQDSADDEESALTRLFDHYLYAAATAMDAVFPGEHDRRPRIAAPLSPIPDVADDPCTAKAWLDSELATLVAISRHTADHGWPAHATRLSATVYRYLDATSAYAEATTIHANALRASRISRDRPGEAGALVAIGIAAWRQARYENAAASLTQALAIYAEIGDQTGEARALHSLGLVHHQQGSYTPAASNFHRALSLFESAGHRQGQASALTALGIVDEQRGKYEQAASHHARAIAIYRATGHRAGEAVALANLGLIDERLGRHQEAADRHRQALALHRQVGNRHGEAAQLVNLGLAMRGQGRYAEAADHYRQALLALREVGSLADEAETLNALGEAMIAQDRQSDARPQYAAALELSAQVGAKFQQARAHDGLAKCGQASGDRDLARVHWEQALALFTELGVPDADEVHMRLDALALGDSVR